VGITGTPVIDPLAGTLYVVAKTKEVTGGVTKFVHRIHALDITSGVEKFGGPFVIPQASFAGTCAPNSGGRVFFNPLRQHQRAGLTLQGNVLYVSWASHCDNNPYTGWIMAFHSQTGKLLGVFNSAPDRGNVPNECRGGVWQGGAAPAIDGGNNLYFATGNGYFNANTTGGQNYGDSQVKLNFSTSGFNVVDYFTPYNQDSLDGIDGDLGSGGVLLLPPQSGTNLRLTVQVGKEGTIYLINRDDMGKFNPSGDTQIVQSLPGAIGGVWGIPAYFNGAVYFGGQYDSLKVFPLSNGFFALNPTSHTGTVFGFPGPTPSISANGSAKGIVWALQTDAYGSNGPAILHAYAAANLALELYNSNQNAVRDQLGPAVKFAVPTIANGKVYVGTANSLAVFGLL
jgi:hypothetical protein